MDGWLDGRRILKLDLVDFVFRDFSLPCRSLVRKLFLQTLLKGRLELLGQWTFQMMDEVRAKAECQIFSTRVDKPYLSCALDPGFMTVIHQILILQALL